MKEIEELRMILRFLVLVIEKDGVVINVNGENCRWGRFGNWWFDMFIE